MASALAVQALGCVGFACHYVLLHFEFGQGVGEEVVFLTLGVAGRH